MNEENGPQTIEIELTADEYKDLVEKGNLLILAVHLCGDCGGIESNTIDNISRSDLKRSPHHRNN